MRFTKQLRQQILDDFISRHGSYDPANFVEEVREAGDTHPAFEWFQWDDETAADQYRIWQARTFVQGLRIKFEVITTKRSISGVVVREAPAYVSPIEDRRAGGGYLQVDMDNADHVAELLRQASVSFETWVRRYGDVFITAGGKESDFAKIRKILTNIENHKMIAAE